MKIILRSKNLVLNQPEQEKLDRDCWTVIIIGLSGMIHCGVSSSITLHEIARETPRSLSHVRRSMLISTHRTLHDGQACDFVGGGPNERTINEAKMPSFVASLALSRFGPDRTEDRILTDFVLEIIVDNRFCLSPTHKKKNVTRNSVLCPRRDLRQVRDNSTPNPAPLRS